MIMESLPKSIFEGKHTRKGMIYKNLHNTIHYLTKEEKNWLCAEADISCDLNGEIENRIRSKKGLIKRYNLQRNFFNNNFKTYMTNQHHCNDAYGQYCVNDIEFQTIARELVDRRLRTEDISDVDLKKLVDNAKIGFGGEIDFRAQLS
jgi:hypothetical protein